jgi:hypothetical protein
VSSLNYNTGIPAANNNPSSDQPLMQTNFNSINTWMGVDHLPFSSTNYGKHQQVQIINQATIPPNLLSGAETIYSKVIGGSGELFFTRGATGTEIQLTGPGNPNNSSPGVTFLPGGMLLQWGSGTSSGITTTPVSFPVTFNNCYGVQLTYLDATAHRNNIGLVTITSSGFSLSIKDSSGNFNALAFYWMAIGKG